MNIRLIIPVTNSSHPFNPDAFNIDERLVLLNLSTQNKNDFYPELIITAHNFLAFLEKSIIEAEEFIRNKIIPKCNKILSHKIPIIFGIDIINGNITFNPYCSGTDSIVALISPNNNSFEYKSHIWEVWESTRENISLAAFLEQKEKRYIQLENSKRACLFSCGDIFQYVHQFELTPSDLYIDLAHINIGKSINRIKNRTVKRLLELNNASSIVIITQNISTTEAKQNNLYFEQISSEEFLYKFVFAMEHQQVTIHNNKSHWIEKYSTMFVDFKC